jgi:shikimate dehydrogenase
MLGAGGAARGAVLPILEHRPAQLVIANRTVATAQALAEQFAALGGEGVVSACGYAIIDGAFDIVINATSASLSAELPPVSPSVFAPGSLAFDMMYAASPTVFLQFAAQHGARCAMASACWSSRPPRRSNCGAACIRRPARCCNNCAASYERGQGEVR